MRSLLVTDRGNIAPAAAAEQLDEAMMSARVLGDEALHVLMH